MITDFLKDHRIQFKEGGEHRNVRYGWIGLQCPWCKSDKYHLGIRVTDGHTTCWKCGGHRLGDTLMELSGQPWSVVSNLIRSFRRSDSFGIRETASRVKIPNGVVPLDDLPLHRKYLKNRGFDPGYLSMMWGVRGIGLASRLGGRLFIPISLRDSVVSWTTRAIGDSQVRYISASPKEESVHHKSVLYGIDLVCGPTIIVVEGPTDAWAIGPGAVATLGLNVSDTQFNEIASYPNRVIIYDSSDAAQHRADQLCHRLKHDRSTTCCVRLESGDDPASADPDEIALVRKNFGLPNSHDD